ncbi:MAG: hypothetical protein MO852_07745, partial [Candidatus Devosia euplotis]|nr:hypothetical protein [Candidatus Devosia euplotis]
RGAALGTVLGGAVAAMIGLILLVRHYGGARSLLNLIPRTDLLDATALKRMFGLSRDLMIWSLALMSAYAWFAAHGARMGEVALSANAILLNLLMVIGFFSMASPRRPNRLPARRSAPIGGPPLIAPMG